MRVGVKQFLAVVGPQTHSDDFIRLDCGAAIRLRAFGWVPGSSAYNITAFFRGTDYGT